jgi:hypothetical protein
MKKSVLIFPFLVLGLSTEMEAQKVTEGVYLSAKDFTSGKISYEHNQNISNYKLYVHDSFKKSTIKIVLGDKTTVLNKDSVYGYRSDDNSFYRFYKSDEYKIINHTEKILMYSLSTTEGAPRNIHQVTNYYFSKDAGSTIYPLTKQNIKTAFANDTKFIELVNTYFEFDSELYAYDSTQKMYNLNRTYEQYLKYK